MWKTGIVKFMVFSDQVLATIPVCNLQSKKNIGRTTFIRKTDFQDFVFSNSARVFSRQHMIQHALGFRAKLFFVYKLWKIIVKPFSGSKAVSLPKSLQATRMHTKSSRVRFQSGLNLRLTLFRIRSIES